MKENKCKSCKYSVKTTNEKGKVLETECRIENPTKVFFFGDCPRYKEKGDS